MTHRSFAVLALVLVCFVPLARAGVIVVDAAGGAGSDFTSIQAAVSAASDGDVLLVRAGTYGSFAVGDVDLDIAAEAGATVIVDGLVEILGLGAGKVVTLTDLELKTATGTPPGYTGQPRLACTGCDGAVWVQDCVIQGVGSTPAGAGLGATSCASLVLVRCQVTGASVGTGTGAAGRGLTAIDSHVLAHDSALKGGNPACVLFVGCGTGGAGALLQGGTLFGEGSSFQGGGLACMLSCPVGGHGLHLSSGSPQATLFDCTATGGPGGPAGQPIKVDSGGVTTLPGVSRDFSVTTPAGEGETATLQWVGQPGDIAALFWGLGPVHLPAPGLSGVLVLSPPTVVVVGTVPGPGSLSIPLVIPELGPGLEGVAVSLQGVFKPSGSAAILSDPARFMLLDASF